MDGDIKVETLTAELPMDEFIASFVDVERFEACCAQCPGYGKTWACPPYSFDPNGVWSRYKSIELYAKKVFVPESMREKHHSADELAKAYNELLTPVKDRLMDELYAMERETPHSLALSAGGCGLCAECTRPHGERCRNPRKMRWSVESLGGDVLKCITQVLGEEVLWAENGRLPEHFILLGGLLKKQ
ncbi:MAG: metal-binding protein [Clostridia bacterium]|nr:metal-binding protein [Clostridia bacterium]